MYYGIDEQVVPSQITGAASNIKAGTNPAYTTSTFFKLYPQFDDITILPSAVLEVYINFATTCIKQARYRGAWEIAMGLFVAHFVTLWLRSSAEVGSDKDAVITAGQTQGIITTESVDGVSYSMDVSLVGNDLDGFASWKSTDFGMQLATMAKLYGKGGMMV
jgi:hypothetical protein